MEDAKSCNFDDERQVDVEGFEYRRRAAHHWKAAKTYENKV